MHNDLQSAWRGEETEESFEESYEYNNYLNGLFRSSAFSRLMQDSTRLSTKQQRNLVKNIQKGKDVEKNLDLLVRANIRFIAFFAKRYVGNSDLEFEDLMNCGVLGMMEAAKRFDLRRNLSFLTYSGFCIRSAMKRELDQSGALTIPVHAKEARCKIFKLLEQENGKKFSVEEIARKIKAPLSLVKNLMLVNYGHVSGLDEINQASLLDGDNHPAALADTVEDERIDLFKERLSADHIKILGRALSSLSAREQGIIKMRFGMEPYIAPMTLHEVGRAYGLTRERVRQIQDSAMKKLRRWFVRNKLTNKDLS